MSRGRFAPSPTGALHLGNVRSALLGWLWARRLGGEFLLRIEDLDPERSRPQFVDLLRRDLEYLGLTWDGPVLLQSQRGEIYAEALERLRAQGMVYPCTCSRAEIARAASAPHVGEEGPVYPGTCRHGGAQPQRPASLRFAVAPGVVEVVDEVHGRLVQEVAREVGDFVLRRADGVASYQLAVVVDDGASGVTHVLRADDLVTSTPRQVLLQRALGLPTPTYAHVPLLLGLDGKRLAKRDGGATVAHWRERKVPPEVVVGKLAQWSGLGDGAAVRAQELVAGFSLSALRREATVVTDAELEGLLSR